MQKSFAKKKNHQQTKQKQNKNTPHKLIVFYFVKDSQATIPESVDGSQDLFNLQAQPLPPLPKDPSEEICMIHFYIYIYKIKYKY